MNTDQKIEEILKIVQGERQLNNSRFTQLATGLMDVKKEISELRVDLTAKIDKVYDALSQDILAFGDDLEKVKRQISRPSKKHHA